MSEAGFRSFERSSRRSREVRIGMAITGPTPIGTGHKLNTRSECAIRYLYLPLVGSRYVNTDRSKGGWTLPTPRLRSSVGWAN